MNIIIDTSIFFQENFLAGKKIENIGKLGNQKVINLFITEINDLEIKNKIKEEFEKLELTENKFIKQLDSNHKIIKNFYSTDTISRIFYDGISEDLIEKYERFKTFSKICVISFPVDFNIKKIVDDYFNLKAPFSDTLKKKTEFPDAISMHIAERHLESLDNSAIYLTLDGDFSTYASERIFIKNDLSEILEEIARQNHPDIFDDAALIVHNIKENSEIIKPFISTEIEIDAMIYLEDFFDKYGLLLKIKDQKTKIVDFTNFEVFDVLENTIGFNCDGNYITEIMMEREDKSYNLFQEKVFTDHHLRFSENGILIFEGTFSTSLYYEYEFPYEPIDETIEISSDKSIKTIKNI